MRILVFEDKYDNVHILDISTEYKYHAALRFIFTRIDISGAYNSNVREKMHQIFKDARSGDIDSIVAILTLRRDVPGEKWYIDAVHDPTK